jgi:hypothetical protein
MQQFHKPYKSDIGAIAISTFISRGAERVNYRDYSLATDYVDYSLVFPHVVLHFLLDEGIVLQKIM